MGVISVLLSVAYWPLLSFGGFLAIILFFAACVLHSLAIYGFGFAISGLFTSSTRASVVTHLISFTCFVSFFILDTATRTGTLIEIPLALYYLLCLIEPFCFCFFLQRVCILIWSTRVLENSRKYHTSIIYYSELDHCFRGRLAVVCSMLCYFIVIKAKSIRYFCKCH